MDSETEVRTVLRTCQITIKDRDPSSTLKITEVEKKKKHLEPYLEQRNHFTPFAASCEGLVGKDPNAFLYRLAKNFQKNGAGPAAEQSPLLERGLLQVQQERKTGALEARECLQRLCPDAHAGKMAQGQVSTPPYHNVSLNALFSKFS